MSEVKGTTTLSEDVVNQIAGVAARRLEGVHALGRTSVLNRLRGDHRGKGVEAEVGEEEAALDIEMILEYGHPLKAVTQKLRETIAQDIKKMLDREVVELNIEVAGIHFPEDDETEEPTRVK